MTVDYLQKLFKLRTCRDSFFKNRTKPCLQYQINRCSAPCVSYIDKVTYQEKVKMAQKFLKGEDSSIAKNITMEMQSAAQEKKYELAAKYRDQLKLLEHIRSQNKIQPTEITDYFGVSVGPHYLCIYQISTCGGLTSEAKPFFYEFDPHVPIEDIMSQFLWQYYQFNFPDNIKTLKCLVSDDIKIPPHFFDTIKQELGQTVKYLHKPKLEDKDLLSLSESNAKLSLRNHTMQSANMLNFLKSLSDDISFENNHYECYDISHQYGEYTSASCIVFNDYGPLKSEYRRYKIKLSKSRDDYEAIYQFIKRRFSKERPLPQLLIIDGGKGQISSVVKALDEINRVNFIILGIAKGPSRKVGFEQYFVSQGAETNLIEPSHEVKQFLSYMRDEAHRFAISHSRLQLKKDRSLSKLEQIPGVGVMKRRQLLSALGGWQEIYQASEDKLASIPQIGPKLAKKIYEFLHQVD